MNRARLVGLLLALIVVAGCSSPGAPGSGVPGIGGVSCTGAATAPGLDSEQTGNARIITQVAYSLGLGEQAATIGVAAAMTESSLRNVNHGDTLGPDSIGLFQQRTPWGPLAQRTDPVGATTLFYTVDNGPGVRGLIHIPGWEKMSVPQAAQAVEGSQFSSGSNYAGVMTLVLGTMKAILPGCQTSITGGTAPLTGGGLSGLMNSSQNPASFGWVHAGPTEQLTWQGRSIGLVARGTAPLWVSFLDALVPTIPGGLNSNVGCFEDRTNRNNPGVLSFHAYAIACDLNSDRNPNGVNPATLSGQYVIPASASQLAHRYGMEWGGDWTGTPDSMHFELHITPAQVAAAIAGKPV